MSPSLKKGETMRLRTPFSTLLLLAFAVCCLAGSAERAVAQSDDAKPAQVVDETNLDTQLYLIVGSDQENQAGKIPANLDLVIKQLRNTLPFKNYRVAATLINRVKNEGRLNLRWVGGPLTPGTPSPQTPSFSDFKVGNIKLVKDANGQQLVRMENFSFGARIPIQAQAVASTAGAVPVLNYESTGLDTQISMREGEPVIVGTLNVGPSGDAIILVVSAKRTAQ
jgi:hypothetical protein